LYFCNRFRITIFQRSILFKTNNYHHGVPPWSEGPGQLTLLPTLIRLWVWVHLQASVSHPGTRKGTTLQNFKWIVILENFRSSTKKWKTDHKKWYTVNQNSFALTWR